MINDEMLQISHFYMHDRILNLELSVWRSRFTLALALSFFACCRRAGLRIQ